MLHNQAYHLLMWRIEECLLKADAGNIEVL